MKKPNPFTYGYRIVSDPMTFSPKGVWDCKEMKALYDEQVEMYEKTIFHLFLAVDISPTKDGDAEMNIPKMFKSDNFCYGAGLKYRILDEDHEKKGDFSFSGSNENRNRQANEVADFVERTQNENPAKRIYFLTIAIEAI
jgi:hypothetical protein